MDHKLHEFKVNTTSEELLDVEWSLHGLNEHLRVARNIRSVTENKIAVAREAIRSTEQKETGTQSSVAARGPQEYDAVHPEFSMQAAWMSESGASDEPQIYGDEQAALRPESGASDEPAEVKVEWEDKDDDGGSFIAGTTRLAERGSSLRQGTAALGQPGADNQAATKPGKMDITTNAGNLWPADLKESEQHVEKSGFDTSDSEIAPPKPRSADIQPCFHLQRSLQTRQESERVIVEESGKM